MRNTVGVSRLQYQQPTAGREHLVRAVQVLNLATDEQTSQVEGFNLADLVALGYLVSPADLGFFVASSGSTNSALILLGAWN